LRAALLLRTGKFCRPMARGVTIITAIQMRWLSASCPETMRSCDTLQNGCTQRESRDLQTVKTSAKQKNRSWICRGSTHFRIEDPIWSSFERTTGRSATWGFSGRLYVLFKLLKPFL